REIRAGRVSLGRYCAGCKAKRWPIAVRAAQCDTGNPARQGRCRKKGCLVTVTRSAFLAGSAIVLALAVPPPPPAQALPDRPVNPAPPPETPLPTDPDQVQFSSGTLEYDNDTDTVTATGDVRMYRQGDKLRADKVTWNRKTGQVVADGKIAV